MLDGPLYSYALALFAGLVVIELVAMARLKRAGYSLRASLASLGVGLGHKLSASIKFGAAGGFALVVWQYRVAEVPLDTWWGLALLFLASEFSYYWFHRLSHEIRWMWATHSVHHSAEELNVLASFRLGWTASLSGAFVVYYPLFLIGLHPLAVATALGLNLLYQAWIHTDLIGKLGPLEYVLNTPSNHRVHHATNPAYIDRNYGGVLIIFDRLFGTYALEKADDPCVYGLMHQVGSDNPLRIAFHEWIAMAKDVAASRSLREVLGHLFGKPGWQPAPNAPRPAPPIVVGDAPVLLHASRPGAPLTR